MLRSSNKLKLDTADKVCQDVCVVNCLESFECFIGHTVGVMAELCQANRMRGIPFLKKQRPLYIFMYKNTFL